MGFVPDCECGHPEAEHGMGGTCVTPQELCPCNKYTPKQRDVIVLIAERIDRELGWTTLPGQGSPNGRRLATMITNDLDDAGYLIRKKRQRRG